MKLITGLANSGRTQILWNRFVSNGGIFITSENIWKLQARDFGENITGTKHAVIVLNRHEDYQIENLMVILEDWARGKPDSLNVFIDNFGEIIPVRQNGVVENFKSLQKFESDFGAVVTICKQKSRNGLLKDVVSGMHGVRFFDNLTEVSINENVNGISYGSLKTFSNSDSMPATEEYTQKFIWSETDFELPVSFQSFNIMLDDISGFPILTLGHEHV